MSKSDISSYRYSQGSSLFRKSVLRRIRFGNTLRLQPDFPNSAASSLRTNYLTESDRRPSCSHSAYPEQCTHQHRHQHRRLSNTLLVPVTTVSTDNVSYDTNVSNQQTLEHMTVPSMTYLPVVPSPTIPEPNLSPSSFPYPSVITEIGNNEISSIVPQQSSSISHLPDCLYAINLSNTMNSLGSNDFVRRNRKARRKENHLDLNCDSTPSMQIADIESESSSGWTNEGMGVSSIPTTTATTSSEPICTCQLLWQLERETDSIDKFKLFFKRGHLNVDWDYVQGSSEV